MKLSSVSILNVEAVGRYSLRLFFSDGTIQLVDFGPFLSEAVHPDLRKWLDPGAFASYRLDHGDLVWGDWELCFPIADLYRGSLSSL